MRLKRLLLCQVGADFDPARHVAAGPWCFAGMEHVHPRWDEDELVEAFAGPEEWAAHLRLTQRLAEQLVATWAERLNFRHGRAYSPRFWRVMALNWLVNATQSLWFRWRHAAALIARHDRPLEIALWRGRGEDWHAADFVAFYRAMLRPRMEYWMTSLVWDALAPSDWPRLEVPPTEADRLTAAAAPPAAEETLSGRLTRTLFGRLPFQSIPGVRAAKLPLSLLILVLPRRPSRDCYDGGFRDTEIFDHFPVAFLDLLDHVLTETLPRSLDRDFPRIEARALGLSYAPGRLLVDTVAAPDDGVRIVAAMAHEKGERVVTSQHGSDYGDRLAVSDAPVLEYPYHGFITWGWKGQSGYRGRFVPLPAPALARTAGRHREAGPALILVGSHMSVRGTRLGAMPQLAEVVRYRRDKLVFIDALAEPARSFLQYRPYRRAIQDLDEEGWLRARTREQLALHEGDLTSAMLGCRLLVLDHPGTTLPVALSANVPTIGFWRPAARPLAPEAEAVYSALAEAGIIHDDPESAARAVERVWSDVQGWWRSEKVQMARSAWCRQYARTAPVWWWHWAKALWHLSRI